MQTDYERLQPRSFTGLTDDEWGRFSQVVKSFLGSGKRSLFISTIIKKVVEDARDQFMQEARVDQRARIAINETKSFFGIARVCDQDADVNNRL